MKRFGFILPLAAVSLVAFTACSSDDTVEDFKTQNPIGFNVLSENSVISRATPITAENLTSTDFDVWAFHGTGTGYFMGSADKGVHINHTTSDAKGTAGNATSGFGTGYWDYADGETIGYWPDDITADNDMKFFAVSPDKDKLQSGVTLTPSISSAGKSVSYTVPTSSNDQIDLMTATTILGARPENGTVSLNFKHALSQIVFTGKVSDASLTATVTGITLHNIKNGVTVTLASANDGDITTAEAGTATNYTAYSSSVDINSATNAIDITGTSPLLLAPQALTPTSITAGTTAPAETTGSYIEVTYGLKQGDNQIKKDGTKFYIPLNDATISAWEHGKKYVYDLTFGADVIKFTATVASWTDGNTSEKTVK